MSIRGRVGAMCGLCFICLVSAAGVCSVSLAVVDSKVLIFFFFLIVPSQVNSKVSVCACHPYGPCMVGTRCAGPTDILHMDLSHWYLVRPMGAAAVVCWNGRGNRAGY